MKPDFSYKLTQRIENFIIENKMIGHGDSVIIGLSGGADSVCLFLLLNKLRTKLNFDIYAVHINHGIRGESADKDEEFSRTLCDKYSVAYKSYKIDVKAVSKEKGITLEEAGRNVRYSCFEKIAEELFDSGKETVKIAVAHHMDDQAETVIFNLLRGSGLKGIGGMSPVSMRKNSGHQIELIRPLLCVSKEEIINFLESNNQEFCVDETNTDNDYSRNLIRNEIIPRLRLLQPKASDHIASLAKEARDAVVYMDEEVEKLYHNAVSMNLDSMGNRAYRLSLEKLKYESDILVKQVIIYTLKQLIDNYKDITRIHIDDVYSLFFKGRGKQIVLPYNLIAIREREYVEIQQK